MELDESGDDYDAEITHFVFDKLIKYEDRDYSRVTGTHFSPQLMEAISGVYTSNDPIDLQSFDPVDYINHLFPNEQSLLDIDTVMNRLKAKSNKLSYEIISDIRGLSNTSERAQSNLRHTTETIQNLFAKINEIKNRAEESETMVQELCRDIKSLDFAKKNVAKTVTGISELLNLVSGVDQLKRWIKERRYGEVGNLLEAIGQHTSSVTEYHDVPTVVSINKQINSIRQELKTKVFEEFSDVDSRKDSRSSQLCDVCFVVDALGPDTKAEFVKWFCDERMREYRRTFLPGSESSSFENFERRYAWFKKEIKTFDKRYSPVFPISWKMHQKLLEAFATITNEFIENTLNYARCEVKVLLHALKETLSFENDICDFFSKLPMFALLTEEDSMLAEAEPESDEEDTIEEVNRNSAEAIARRMEAFKRRKEKERLKQERKEKNLQVSFSRFKGIISKVFDPFMNIYTDQEDQLMQQKLEQLLTDEKWNIEDDCKNRVLQSSADLIIYFKKSMKRCMALTKNQAFYTIYTFFKKYLGLYAAALNHRVETMCQEAMEGREIELFERTTCLVINTAAYCATICDQLSDAVLKHIDKAFSENISMKEEQTQFQRLVFTSIKALSDCLKQRIDSALQLMSKINWVTLDFVGDQSEYVNQISFHIRSSVPLLNSWLSPTHFRFFCESFVNDCIPLIVQHIFKCKQISEVGAEQMLLDIIGIKAIFLEMPTRLDPRFQNTQTQPPPPPVAPEKYVAAVKREMSKAEKLLKLILTPTSALPDAYVEIVKEGSDARLTRLMELKGVPKGEQSAVLDQYHRLKAIKRTKTQSQSSSSSSSSSSNNL